MPSILLRGVPSVALDEQKIIDFSYDDQRDRGFRAADI